MVEIANSPKGALFCAPKVFCATYDELCRIVITYKNLKIIIFSWYAHIWHTIHNFELAVKCAWWVISKSAYIFRHEIVHTFLCALSNFPHMLYLNRCIFTIKKFPPFELSTPLWTSHYLNFSPSQCTRKMHCTVSPHFTCGKMEF